MRWYTAETAVVGLSSPSCRSWWQRCRGGAASWKRSCGRCVAPKCTAREQEVHLRAQFGQTKIEFIGTNCS